jgi:hypothetical protein
LARASIIQLEPNEELIVIFQMPGYSTDMSAASFPSLIGLELAGSVPSGSATAAIPGSSASYYSGMMLQASVQSSDGMLSLPLFDADSWRLGLPTGDVVAGVNPGGGAISYADVALSLSMSEALFGTSGQFEIAITNKGSEMTIGLGTGYSLSNAILATLTADGGAVQSAAYLESYQVLNPAQSVTPGFSAQTGAAVPEPGTTGATVIGGAALVWLWCKRIRPGLRSD